MTYHQFKSQTPYNSREKDLDEGIPWSEAQGEASGDGLKRGVARSTNDDSAKEEGTKQTRLLRRCHNREADDNSTTTATTRTTSQKNNKSGTSEGRRRRVDVGDDVQRTWRDE